MKDEALKLALEAAYLAGFNASGEGWNGEYPFGDYSQQPEQDKNWCAERDDFIKQALAAPVQELVKPSLWEQYQAAQPAPVQEPVAWGVFESNLHDMFFTQEEAQEMAKLKGSHAEVRPLYTIPPAAQPAVPDAIGPNEDELPAYAAGWNDCRQAMLKARGNT